MNVFSDKEEYTTFGCTSRKNQCLNSKSKFDQSTHIKGIIEFYIQAIELWKSLNTKWYRRFTYKTDTKWSRRVKKIDQKIYEEVVGDLEIMN